MVDTADLGSVYCGFKSHLQYKRERRRKGENRTQSVMRKHEMLGRRSERESREKGESQKRRNVKRDGKRVRKEGKEERAYYNTECYGESTGKDGRKKEGSGKSEPTMVVLNKP